MKVPIQDKYKESIVLDRPRWFYYGLGACEQFQKKSGISIMRLFQEFSRPDFQPTENFGNILLFIWAGLVAEDPELVLEDIGALIDYAPGDNITERLQYVIERATRAAAKAFGGEKKSTDPEIQTPAT